MKIKGFVGQTKIDLEVKDFSLSHEICMGIRHGLYGNGDNNDSNVPRMAAEALKSIAQRISDLGNGDAVTPLGAIEGLSVQIKEGLDSIAEAIPSTIEIKFSNDIINVKNVD